MATPQHLHSLQAFVADSPIFVRIDFSCKQVDEEDPHEVAKALQKGTTSLCESIVTSTDKEAEVEAQLWPTFLTTCKADAIISHDAKQDRSTILIALRGMLSREHLLRTMKVWETDMRSTALFIDYIPTPTLAVLLVDREDLGQLVVDIWTGPELGSNAITAFTSTSTSSIPIHLDAPAARLSGAGSTVATVTIQSCPSPIRKLTPALSILHRLRWDNAFDRKEFVVVYEDRHDGLMESPVECWVTDSTDDSFVPMHRIRAVKKKSTGQVVWHRLQRIDLISGE